MKVVLCPKNNFITYRKYLQSFILLSLSAHNQVFFKLNCYTTVISHSKLKVLMPVIKGTGAYASDLPFKGAYASDLPFKGAYASDLPFKGAYTSDLPFKGAYTSDLPFKGAYASDLPFKGSHTHKKQQHYSYS